MKPPTLSDVARLAGVSVPTASRILNGGVRGAGSGVPETRQRVKEAARVLGYSVSPAAQAIKDGRSRSVAMLVNDIDDYGSAVMISGVMRAAEKRGMSVAVRTTFDDAERELDLLNQLRGERHRVFIMAASRTTEFSREAAVEAQLAILRDEGTSVVLVGDSELGYPHVTVDNHEAAALLAGALADAGRKKFAIVSGLSTQITARDRVDGFVEGLAARGIAVRPADIVHREFSRDGGYVAVDALRDRLGELDVIAGMSDAMAVGVIARLRELGVESPTDIEVTGFDHVPMLGDVMPGFTTVEVPLEAFGEAALALALDGVPPGAGARVALQATPIIHGVPMRRR